MTPLSRIDPVGRLAPSPTGLLHLGHARTFVLGWAHVRSRGGRVVLRIDDLDAQRSSDKLEAAALRDLEWLGLDWDGRVTRQSERHTDYQAALARLELLGSTYPCVCSRKDIEQAQTAPHADTEEPRYPGTCRNRFADVDSAERSSGRPAGIRFRAPDQSLEFEDGIRGPQHFNVQTEVGDFLVARRDKQATYQLACVVDDDLDGVNEVFRGDDLLPSTARQHWLQQALELPHPKWFHAPLVCDDQGRRLAKRHDDLSLQELRLGGTDPRAVLAWAATSFGLAAGERPDAINPFFAEQRMAANDVVRSFSLDRIQRQPIRLTQDSIDALRRAR